MTNDSQSPPPVYAQIDATIAGLLEARDYLADHGDDFARMFRMSSAEVNVVSVTITDNRQRFDLVTETFTGDPRGREVYAVGGGDNDVVIMPLSAGVQLKAQASRVASGRVRRVLVPAVPA